MWPMIDTLRPLVDVLSPTFTAPTLVTCSTLLIAWVMTLGKRTLIRVGEYSHPEFLPDHHQRHGLDSFYNFFERSSWHPCDLARRVGVLILTRLPFPGPITLLVDDTLTHKTGKCVWGLGWFRDAVASTRKRVATASGHNWVLVAIAFCNPVTGSPILAIPLLAMLHEPGKGKPSCPALAREMLLMILQWYPNHRFILVGDGAYAAKELLRELPRQAGYVGRMRGDAAVYDANVPQPLKQKKGKGGRKAKKGPRLPSPRDAAKKADWKRKQEGPWQWHRITVCVYGKERELDALSYEAVWPHVLGLQRIKIVAVRDPSRQMDDIYLFTTEVNASMEWVITQFAWRWSIETAFRASKQFMDIEAPQHFCEQSVGKVVPWIWSMQSVIMVWYLTEGHALTEAKEIEQRMGAWESRWSLRHMIRVLRHVTLRSVINSNSDSEVKLNQLVQLLENYILMAA